MDMQEHIIPRVMVSVHMAAAVIVGYMSFVIKDGYYSFGLAVAVLFLMGFLLEKFVIKQKKGVKWWLSNGGMIYIFVWIATWIVLFNL